MTTKPKSTLPRRRARCTLHLGGTDALTVALFPNRIFSVETCRLHWSTPLAPVLGRILIRHAMPTTDRATLQTDFERWFKIGRGYCGWPDLPDVIATAGWAEGPWIHYGLRAGDFFAKMSLSRHTAIPLGVAQFSARVPPRALALAVGRFAITHHEVFHAARLGNQPPT